MAAADETWIDLLDPDAGALRERAPFALHPLAAERLLARPEHADEPRPSLTSHGDYVFGVFLVAVADREHDRVRYQEVDVVLTADHVLTVRKTPPDGAPFDASDAREACRPGDPPGVVLAHLVDAVAERFLDLVDGIDEELDELDDGIETWEPERVRQRVSGLRHDLLHVRRTLAPTRDAVRSVVDDRVDLADGTAFPREVELRLGAVYDKLQRATEGLEFSRDVLQGIRDYHQAKIANDQNEVVKRLTVIASLLLAPTFIVGVYGQNFKHRFPEIGWGWGYPFSWALIVATTLGQLWWFRRKRWI